MKTVYSQLITVINWSWDTREIYEPIIMTYCLYSGGPNPGTLENVCEALEKINRWSGTVRSNGWSWWSVRTIGDDWGQLK